MACLFNLVTVAFVAVAYCGFFADAVEIPESCKNKMLCSEKPDFYDELQKDIDAKFKPIQKLWNLENDEDYLVEGENVVESEYNCRYIEKVEKPYLLRTNETTKVIVQASFYSQKFKTVECLPSDENSVTGDQCFTGLTASSKGYCSPKSTTIALYIYDNTSGKIERISLSIPVCCSCSIQ